jgi:hypothetical protein
VSSCSGSSWEVIFVSFIFGIQNNAQWSKSRRNDFVPFFFLSIILLCTKVGHGIELLVPVAKARIVTAFISSLCHNVRGTNPNQIIISAPNFFNGFFKKDDPILIVRVQEGCIAMMTPTVAFKLKFQIVFLTSVKLRLPLECSTYPFCRKPVIAKVGVRYCHTLKMSQNNVVQNQVAGYPSKSSSCSPHLFPSLKELVPLPSCEQELPLHHQDTIRANSPFLHPSKVKPVTLTSTISTPNGTHTHVETKCILRNESGATDAMESKSSVVGTYANLVNVIVGAGIVGIPYAMKETGLVAGLVLLIFVSILTDKTLRLLIETGKHCNVSSYEMLMEASFGRKGFVFISLNMFIMNFGAMICYLLIIKDNFSALIGLEEEDLWGRRLVLIVSSLVIILPLSMQRVSKLYYRGLQMLF